jgi:hypothetical protein
MDHHGVSPLKVLDSGSDLLHISSDLMSKDMGELDGKRKTKSDETMIRIAKAAGAYFYQHIVVPHGRDIDIFDFKRFPRFIEQGRLHLPPPYSHSMTRLRHEPAF